MATKIRHERTKNSHERITESITLIETMFKKYKEKPRWELLQAMFREVLILGREIGKQEALHNQKIINVRKKRK